MQQIIQRRWLAFWLCFIFALAGVFLVHAALLDLDAFVSFAILDEDLNVFPDEALVMIVGSGDDQVQDPGGMRTFGTDLVARSTTGDDIILGTVRIGDNTTNAGQFFTTVQYDPAEVSYAYIRFFLWTNPEPVTGIVNFGTSSVFELVPTLGVAEVDFSPDGNLVATEVNNFVVIPEPGTGNLLLLFFGVLGGLRAQMRRRERERKRRDR